MVFKDRREAAIGLAARLQDVLPESDCVVLAIPRGGAVIGDVVASLLSARLDVVVPRKLGAPENPELGIGAVAEEGVCLLNEHLIDQLGIDQEYIEKKKAEQLEVVARRTTAYRGGRPPIPVAGKTAVIVDDGLATGFTALAAVEAARRRGAQRIVLAIPVAPPATIERFEELVEEVVCLEAPRHFYAVGQFYGDFTQVDDEAVVEIMKRHHAKTGPGDTTDRRGAA